MADLKAQLAGFGEELVFAANSIRSRGAKHYGRALAMTAFAVFASWKFVFVTSGEKLKRVQGQLVAARATAKYADTFKELDDRLRMFAERLPPSGRAEAWLLDTVRESMKAEGIFSTSLTPVQVTEGARFRVLSLRMSCRARWKEVGSWIARMESSRQLLHVSNIVIKKDTAQIGTNDVEVTVSSLVPKGGGP